MRYEHLPVASPSRVGGYAVFSVEVLGQAVPTTGNKTGETVVACYPMTVATRVVVPASTTLPGTLLPNYQPGDLSTLIVIFQLLAQVPTLCKHLLKFLFSILYYLSVNIFIHRFTELLHN